MRYITKEEMESLPSYPWIEQALYYGTDPEWQPGRTRRSWPCTRDDRCLTVQALYNLSRWSGWKSSSLGREERGMADAIGNIPLYQLMELSRGRRMNQPAFFPEGDLLREGKNG